MGYATVQNLPRGVRAYEKAKQIHNSIKPIRGRSPEIRPLGARRDADIYKIRMKEGGVGEGGTELGAIEVVLYKTPIITYYPNGEIHIKTDLWSTPSTHQTLSWVLDLKVNGAKGGGKTVVTMSDGMKYLLGNNEVLKLRLEGNTWGSEYLVPVDAPTPKGYRVNRKAMGEVRKKYSEFAKYMKGFVSLRTHDQSYERYGRHYTHKEISFSIGEAVEVLGRKLVKPNNAINAGYYLDHIEYYTISKLPNEVRWLRGDATIEHYNEYTSKFLQLCESHEDENVQHANHYKAMMILLTTEGNFGNGLILANDEDLTNVRSIKNPNFVERFEGVIKRFHRREIFDLVDMKHGEIPNAEYNEWMKN